MELPGQTRAIFRACDREKAKAYVSSGKPEYLLTSGPGDFHLNEPATYFCQPEEVFEGNAELLVLLNLGKTI